jgi:hypothetical protein
MTPPWRRRAIGAGIAAFLVTGCGVPSQTEPHVIPDAALPAEPTTTRPATEPRIETRVFFLRDDRLVAVSRRAGGATVDDALRALLSGPTDAEIASGVRTAIPAGATVRVERDGSGVATLDLGSLFDGVTGEEQILVFAQLVLTATDGPAASGVVFRRGGRRIDAPTVDGTLVSRPVTADDYAPLLTPAP